MVALPNEIDVGPFIYTVTDDPAVLDAESERQGIDLYAFLDTVALIIGIEVGQAEAQKRDSLLHEVFHAVAALTGIDVEIDAADLEPLIRRMATGLLGVLRDNPDLVTYLTAEP